MLLSASCCPTLHAEVQSLPSNESSSFLIASPQRHALMLLLCAYSALKNPKPIFQTPVPCDQRTASLKAADRVKCHVQALLFAVHFLMTHADRISPPFLLGIGSPQVSRNIYPFRVAVFSNTPCLFLYTQTSSK